MQTSPIEVQKALKGMGYPASKQDLIKKAKDNDAPQEVMQVLENLPDKKFENAVDVSREFKGEGGGRSSQGHGGRGGSRRGRGEEESSRESHKGGQEGHGASHRGAGSSPIEVQKALKGMDYPANKEDLIEKARDNDASEEVMQVLENIPDKEYESAVDVSREFKGEGQEEGGRGGGRSSQAQGGRGGNKGGQEEGGRESHKGGRGRKED